MLVAIHSRSRRTVGFLTLILSAACTTGTTTASAGDVAVGPTMRSLPTASEMLASWPAKQRETGTMLVQKYGPPDAVDDQMMAWFNRVPFTKIVLTRTAVPHAFPMAHEDFLTQTVMHRVPADKLDDLYEYDGSVWHHRTRGELSAQCDIEPFNLLALNLAHDIVMSRRTVADARAMYARTAMAYKNGDRSSAYTAGLMFQPEPQAADPDRPFTP